MLGKYTYCKTIWIVFLLVSLLAAGMMGTAFGETDEIQLEKKRNGKLSITCFMESKLLWKV